MKRIEQKRAVSPVIASVFLIILVMVLATIVFMWAKEFFKEDIAKFDQPIENSCEKVNLKAKIIEGNLYVQNNGQVPVYKIKLKKESSGNIDLIEYPEGDLDKNLLEIGEAEIFDDADLTDVNSIIAILRGKIKSGKIKEYICADTEFYIE